MTTYGGHDWQVGETITEVHLQAMDDAARDSIPRAEVAATYSPRPRSGSLPAIPASGAVPLNLTGFRRGLRRVEAGTGTCRILCVGDSTTMGVGAGTAAGGVDSYPYALLNRFNGFLAPGSYTLGIPQQAGANDGRWVASGGWVLAAGVPVIGFGGRAYYVNSRTTGTLTYTPGNIADTVTVYFLGSSGNPVVPVTIDGVAAADLNMSVGNGWTKQSYTVPLGTHTIGFGTPGGAGTGQAFITAIEASDSSRHEVQVANAGVGSSTSWDWTNLSVSATFNGAAGITTFAPDLTILMLDINDARASLPVADHTANLQTLISAAKATGSVLLLSGSPAATSEPGYALGAQYRDAGIALAAANGAPFIDLYARLGSNAAALGTGLGADTIGHLTTAGYADLAEAIFQTLLVAA